MSTSYRTGMSWSARLLIGLVLLLLGAAAATWGLARYQPAARFLGVAPAETPVAPSRVVAAPPVQASAGSSVPDQAGDERECDRSEDRERPPYQKKKVPHARHTNNLLVACKSRASRYPAEA